MGRKMQGAVGYLSAQDLVPIVYFVYCPYQPFPNHAEIPATQP